MRTAVRYPFVFIVLVGSSWLIMNTVTAIAQLITDVTLAPGGPGTQVYNKGNRVAFAWN
jgi:hypothetical protein